MTKARAGVLMMGAAVLAAAAALSLTLVTGARAGQSQPFHLVRPQPVPSMVAVQPPPVEVHVEEAVIATGQPPAVAAVERHVTVAVADVDEGGGVVIRNSGVATASTGGNVVSAGGSVVTGPATAVANRSTVSVGR